MNRLGVLAVLVVACAGGLSTAEARSVTVVFRFDDYAPWTDVVELQRVINPFLQRGLPISVGVVPYDGDFDRVTKGTKLTPLTVEQVAYLRKSLKTGSLEVALHGCTHQDNRSNAKRPSSEFASLSCKRQLERIRYGKAELQQTLGVRPVSFIAPFNTYDANTLRAVERCGFRVFSADEGDGPFGYGMAERRTHMRFAGCSESLDTLKERIDLARKSSDEAPLVTALFHSFDFRELEPKTGGYSLEALGELLDWVKTQPDVRVELLSAAARRPNKPGH